MKKPSTPGDERRPRKRAYQRPAIRSSERIYEKGGLACGKNPDTNPGNIDCQSIPTVS